MAAGKVVVLAVILTAGLVWTTSAAASCIPNRGSDQTTDWEDGWAAGPFSGTVCLNGSYAYIANHSPYVHGLTTTAWTMLMNNANGGYAQIGWMKGADGNRWNFSEWDDADSGWVFLQKTYGASPIGSSPNYRVTYSSGAFHFLIDGVDYRDVSSPSYGGCAAEQAGEIHDLASQMPGEPSNHDAFTAAHVRNASDNSWFATSLWRTYAGTPGGADGFYFDSSTSGNPPTEIDIWDKCT